MPLEYPFGPPPSTPLGYTEGDPPPPPRPRREVTFADWDDTISYEGRISRAHYLVVLGRVSLANCLIVWAAHLLSLPDMVTTVLDVASSLFILPGSVRRINDMGRNVWVWLGPTAVGMLNLPLPYLGGVLYAWGFVAISLATSLKGHEGPNAHGADPDTRFITPQWRTWVAVALLSLAGLRGIVSSAIDYELHGAKAAMQDMGVPPQLQQQMQDQLKQLLPALGQ